MAQVSFQCPHCLNLAGFTSDSHSILNWDECIFLVFCICQVCKKGLCAEIQSELFKKELASKIIDSFDFFTFLHANKGYAIINTYPKAETPQTPEHTPKNIANIYIQGRNAFNQKAFDAAAMSMRKALEMTVKSLVTDPKAKTLFQKIESLKNDDLIPKNMVEWAHQVRDIGNDGAHDIISEKDADDIVFFTEMFLTYIYTLPTKIAERRESVSDSAE